MEIWKKPELVVFARGRPEEIVLAACKSCAVGGPTHQVISKCHLNWGVDECREITPS